MTPTFGIVGQYLCGLTAFSRHCRFVLCNVLWPLIVTTETAIYGPVIFATELVT